MSVFYIRDTCPGTCPSSVLMSVILFEWKQGAATPPTRSVWKIPQARRGKPRTALPGSIVACTRACTRDMT